uniref:ornithine decarboxylase n=1 Tax=Hadrurus spadix TaxID=141984 RepID=A0A1W7RA06_9SCOR
MKSQTGLPSVDVVLDKTMMDVVREIAAVNDDEPFYTVDLGDIVYKYKLWRLNLPRVHPFYAVKCNNNSLVLELLAALGTGFDCASKAEIEAVLKMDVDPSRIIFANPCKTGSFIKYAATVGVDVMTFDNEMELHKTKRLHPGAKMVIRIRADDSSSICRLGIKFGCEVTHAPYLLQVAKEIGVDVVGVSFHVGSGCRDASAYSRAIESSHYVFSVGQKLGFTFTLLDIGGGFPGSRDADVSFEEIASVVNNALETYFPAEMGIEIISEPGRFFVASAFTLTTNIIARRITDDTNEDGIKEQGRMYYLSDGVYGSFNCLIFDHAVVSPFPLDLKNTPLLKSSLWGPTCDSMDKVMDNCYLPHMEAGEFLVFENMGAYTICAASNFNGFETPPLNFFMPQHALIYLQQLPSWPCLRNALTPEQSELLDSNTDNSVPNSSETMHLCSVPEVVVA